MHRIRKVGELAREAFKEIKKLQNKEKELFKTGVEAFDTHIGGLLPGDVCTIAGLPGTAKSHTLYSLLETAMKGETNKNAKDFVSLEYSFEMKMLNKMIRASSSTLGKTKREVIFEAFLEEEAEKMRAYYEDLNDERRYVCEDPLTPEEFYKLTKEYCEKNKDKEAVLISIDHILLFVGTDKNIVLNKVSEYINLLKIEFNNVYFFLLSQLNRSASSVNEEKNNAMRPDNSMLFGSSFMEQLSSYILILSNPFKMGVSQYLKVKSERYEYLEEYFGDRDNKNRISFDTLGKIFCHVTKTRESDTPWKDLFVIDMTLTEKQLEDLKKSQEETKVAPPIEQHQMPVFEDIGQLF